MCPKVFAAFRGMLYEFPSSIGQRLLWYLDRYRGQDGALNCPVLCRLRGPLDGTAMRLSLDDLTARHESLRTTFIRRGRDISQVIHEPKSIPLAEVDLSQAADPEAVFQEKLTEELCTPIDVTVWPLRATLYRTAEQQYALCINMHHMVTDAWSCGIVLREICLFYESRLGMNATIPRAGWQYSHFSEWQRQLLQDNTRKQQLYWQRKLENARLPALPLDNNQNFMATRRSARQTGDIEQSFAEPLRQFARKRKTTVFNIMLSCYYTLLHLLSRQNDLTVACLFANRQEPEVQQTVGFIANMLLLRTRLDRAIRFTDVLSSTHMTVMDAILYQAIPYYVLPMAQVRSEQRRLDDVVFQMMPLPLQDARMANVDVEVIVPEGVGSRFELELVLVPKDGGFRAVLFYNGDRLDSAWACRFISSYTHIVRVISANPEATLADLGKAV